MAFVNTICPKSYFFESNELIDRSTKHSSQTGGGSYLCGFQGSTTSWIRLLGSPLPHKSALGHMTCLGHMLDISKCHQHLPTGVCPIGILPLKDSHHAVKKLRIDSGMMRIP